MIGTKNYDLSVNREKEDGSLSLTSESKLLREYCGVHTFANLNLKEKSLQEWAMIEVTINQIKACNLIQQSR